VNAVSSSVDGKRARAAGKRSGKEQRMFGADKSSGSREVGRVL
jgi:hypothetical protein